MTVLRRGRETDIPFMMRVERSPGYEWVVGRWDEAAHRAGMADAGTGIFVAEEDGQPAGFAILLHLDDAYGNVLLKRIAVAVPGRGVGRALMEGVLAAVFSRAKPYRLWLTVAPHNERGRRLYAGLGFREEGAMRDAHVAPDGSRFSPLVMSILRPEWEALQATGVRPIP